MPPTEQSFKSHTRRDLVFSIALIILVINFFVVLVQAVRTDLIQFAPITILWVLVAAALVIIAVKARTNPLKVQDRVIRLEERLRYASILAQPLLASSEALAVPQVIALRFASDAELPALAQRTIAENLTPRQIKESIQTWRADHHRV